MILKGFKVKSNEKYLNHILKERLENASNKPVRSLGVIIHLKEFNYLKAFESLAKALNIRPNRLEIISFSNEEKLDVLTWEKCFNSDDFGWKGTIKNVELEDFLNKKFDALISFYESDILELKLLTAMSKANFKIGLFQADQRLNDLIIKTGITEFEVFKAEVIKYLTILNKVNNE